MLTLGIDTSGPAGTVALVREGKLLGESRLDESGRRHARSLVAEIDRLFQQTGLRVADCEAVAVSIGPGSFTGLRVGVVAAKTLAYAAGWRLAAVDTFLAIAENGPPEVDDLWVTANAQRGEVYVGRYLRRGDRYFARAGELSIRPLSAFCRELGAGDVISGPGAALLPAEAADRVRVLAPEHRQPRAGIVARLGEEAIAAGITADVWTLVPLYLRRSAAEEQWDRPT
ncbi:MAG TPA: tRNA (adenosine(37)-N6)-threonylcarbamoyltransferase complex dimerization subunit type 1 TsaB [Planctomycetaceae bacterium]|nr:tRNA (adenosine(37)-N6)-threonylcarbamoyltransferase complex dimerization subunit type 1 TsaB [Planctomycetaceae bacterium]